MVILIMIKKALYCSSQHDFNDNYKFIGGCSENKNTNYIIIIVTI